MITLIAESKSMRPSDPANFCCGNRHTIPLLQEEARFLVGKYSALTVPELASALGVSLSLARKSEDLFGGFNDCAPGFDALHAFTGEVFRALDVGSLSDIVLKRAERRLRIVSSLYGLLRPSDVIKPYRLEYTATVPGTSHKIQQYWKAPLTVAFVRHLKDLDCRAIVNLLPEDASKCIDWKIVKAFASVLKPAFKTVASDGSLKTPSTGVLKYLRGRVARELLENDITCLQDVMKMKSPDLGIDPDFSKPGMPVFVYSP